MLDNCEHVQEAATALAAELLSSCPGVRVLATSRHALALPGELVLTVPPLPMPGPGQAAGSPEALMHYDAVRLFVDRATASWSSFRVTAANQDALAELVRRLDGMPLAIELASVRARSLTVQQILDRLSDRFALLTRGNRAALPRQQTLQALLDWSHDLLEPRERLAWARASVFSGGFDLAALEAVACDDDLPGAALADVVDALVAKSVLVRESGEIGGAARFHMLESLREYGDARLAETGGAAPYAERHRRWYAGLAATAAGELFGPAQVDWFARLRADHDNLRAALERLAHDPADAVEGLRMAAALQHHWVMVGRFGEGRAWAERLLAQLPAPGDDEPVERSVARAAGLEVAGRLAVLQGQIDVGRPLLEEALAAATAAGDATWRAHALHGLALASAFWGEPAAALPLPGGGAGAAPGGHGPVRRPARAGPARHRARHPGRPGPGDGVRRGVHRAQRGRLRALVRGHGALGGGPGAVAARTRGPGAHVRPRRAPAQGALRRPDGHGDVGRGGRVGRVRGGPRRGGRPAPRRGAGRARLDRCEPLRPPARGPRPLPRADPRGAGRARPSGGPSRRGRRCASTTRSRSRSGDVRRLPRPRTREATRSG